MRRLDDKTLEEITGGTNKLGGAPPWTVLGYGNGYVFPGPDFGLLNAALSANEMGVEHIPITNNLKQ